MRSKLLATAVAAVAIVTIASPSLARHLSREEAMQRCNALVSTHRSMSMSADTQRSAAWKACMHRLGFRP